MSETLNLTSSQEDYLEAIAELSEAHLHAHCKDIADRLKVAVPSVTSALKVLSEKGLINYTSYQPITLTPPGEKLAAAIRERHRALKRFFIEILGVPEAEADETACRIEHVISPEVTGRMQAFFAAVKNCPHCRDWHVPEAGSRSANVRLDKLPIGGRARIAAVDDHFAARQRFADLGLVVGTELCMERPAPFGDPIRLRLKGGSIAIRRKEAAHLYVIPLAEPEEEGHE